MFQCGCSDPISERKCFLKCASNSCQNSNRSDPISSLQITVYEITVHAHPYIIRVLESSLISRTSSELIDTIQSEIKCTDAKLYAECRSIYQLQYGIHFLIETCTRNICLYMSFYTKFICVYNSGYGIHFEIRNYIQNIFLYADLYMQYIYVYIIVPVASCTEGISVCGIACGKYFCIWNGIPISPQLIYGTYFHPRSWSPMQSSSQLP